MSQNNPNHKTYRILALTCTLLLAVGSHYSAHTLGTLKSHVKSHLDISNSRYGVLQSCVSIVNTILPIVGGWIADRFGNRKASLLATTLILIGSLVIALSTNLTSFTLMVIGRILYGLGSGAIVVVQDSMLSAWFTGKTLAISIGLQIATSRLVCIYSVQLCAYRHRFWPWRRWCGSWKHLGFMGQRSG
jgi:MFS family permease